MDYVAVSDDLAPLFSECGVDHAIHLSGKESIDHLLTFATAAWPPSWSGKGRKLRGQRAPAAVRVCPQLVADPRRQRAFQNARWAVLPDVFTAELSSDGLHTKVIDEIQRAQAQ